MEMQVLDSLAGIGAALPDHPARPGHALGLGDFRNDLENVGNDCAVFGGYAIAVGNVRFGHHQHMGGRLGIDVPEGEDGFVLVDLGGGDLPGNDFTEQTIGHFNTS